MILAVLVLHFPLANLVTAAMLLHTGASISGICRHWIVWTLEYRAVSLAGVLLFTVVSIMYYYGISVKQKWHILLAWRDLQHHGLAACWGLISLVCE